MKFYKIVNPIYNKYHDGINTRPVEYCSTADCVIGGIEFSREGVLDFLNDKDSDLYEVEPLSYTCETKQYGDEYKSWVSSSVKLTYLGKVMDNIPFLIEQGANLNDHLIREIADSGRFDIFKYFVENDIYLEKGLDNLLYLAAEYGNLKIVKYLVGKGADIHYDDECALRSAAMYGFFNVVKYCLDHDADIHANYDEAFCSAAEYGHLKIVKYLVSKGADYHACGDDALFQATLEENFSVMRYLKSLL